MTVKARISSGLNNNSLYSLILSILILSGCAITKNGTETSGDIETGAIAGRVTDLKKIPVEGVMITATHIESGFGDVEYTEIDGSYRFDDLQMGDYELVAEKLGYTQNIEQLFLKKALTKLADVKIQRALGTEQFSTKRPKNYSVVDIYFGTDRAKALGRGARSSYSGKRGNGFEYGVAKVAIPRDHRLGTFESPSIWRLEFRSDPNKHVTLLSVSSIQPIDLEDHLTMTNAALVFVHGYNVSFDDAARRSAQIFYDLKFNGTPVLYSWPSNGKTLSYIEDLDNAERSSTRFADFVSVLSKHAATVDVVAHSMGNQVLIRGLEILSHRGNFTEPVLDEIALVAPDVDAEMFEEILPMLRPLGERMTLYVSANDKTLNLSKKIRGGYHRLGDFDNTLGPVVLPRVDTIDVSSLETGLLGHSYYGDHRSVLSDLYELIATGSAPDMRFGLESTTFGEKEFWRFRP